MSGRPSERMLDAIADEDRPSLSLEQLDEEEIPGRIYPVRAEDDAFSEADDFATMVFFEEPASAAAGRDRRSVPIAMVERDVMTLFPINTRPEKLDYLKPKYGSLDRIVIAAPVAGPYERPEEVDDFLSMLESLPAGFQKRYEFGLGLHWEYRSIWSALSEAYQANTLVVHGGKSIEARDGYVFLPVSDFHRLRHQLDGIAKKYQRRAKADKDSLVYDEILRKIDAQRFKPRTKKLVPDEISELVGAHAKNTKLSRRDRHAVLNLVGSNAEQLASDEGHALLKLKSEIELVTLAQLIEKMESQLPKKLTEGDWQRFFVQNVFVLSLVLAVPALLVQERPFMGGTRIDGSGSKLGDFLLAARSTGNLAIVEIKTPRTELLMERAYRPPDLYGPSTSLSGGVTQILDQRNKLQINFANLKLASRLHDIEGHAVRCFLIAGTTPTDDDKKKSFELFRNSLNSVEIITFDELLEKLKEIHRALTPEPSVLTAEGIPF
jgi:Domain of unknown function (DUF4263)